MSSFRRYTFGPGSLESVTLFRRERADADSIRYEYRLRGSFTVYCGNGWDHTADVTSSDWYSLTGDPFDTYQMAHELVNLVLEDWSDPCEDEPAYVPTSSDPCSSCKHPFSEHEEDEDAPYGRGICWRKDDLGSPICACNLFLE